MRNEKFEAEAARILGFDIETIRDSYCDGKYSHWDYSSIYAFWAGYMTALGFKVPSESESSHDPEEN